MRLMILSARQGTAVTTQPMMKLSTATLPRQAGKSMNLREQVDRVGRILAFFAVIAGLSFAQTGRAAEPTSSAGYFDNSGRADVLSGGVRTLELQTPRGKFKVWTKRVGNNPRIKLLLLHGGPGATHKYFEACDSFLPAARVEYYYYAQPR